MGMGEPFDNLDEVLKVLEILTSEYGYGWSPKRITVSSVGLKKGLERFLNESDCHLAISMHTPIPSQRRDLMPAEKAFPLRKLLIYCIIMILANSGVCLLSISYSKG